jgi:hypothetical protein
MLLKRDVLYLAQGNSIAGACHIIIGIHLSCASKVEPLLLKEPPPTPPGPLRSSIWEPFNRTDYSISLAKDDDNFCRQDVCFTATMTIPTGVPTSILIKYFLHHTGLDKNCLTGSLVVSTEGLCPPFDACPNTNLFQHLFGIKFAYENHLHVRGILPFEFACCFGFTDDLTYRLSHPKNKFCLDSAIPGCTSSWLFEQIHAYLIFLCDSNCEILSPKQYAAPAATIQAFVNGAIGLRLPSHNRWVKAYSDNTECSTLGHLAKNPGAICKEALKNVHYCYRQPLRQSQIVIEDNMLIYCDSIRGSHSYTWLQIVPKALFGIVFVAFHSNPIDDHFNAYCTLHRLRLCYFWPEMYSYIKKMCQACPGCALSNPSCRNSSELVYHFPIKAPFHLWMHIRRAIMPALRGTRPMLSLVAG